MSCSVADFQLHIIHSWLASKPNSPIWVSKCQRDTSLWSNTLASVEGCALCFHAVPSSHRLPCVCARGLWGDGSPRNLPPCEAS